MTTNITALENRTLERLTFSTLNNNEELQDNRALGGYTKMVHKAINDGLYDVLAICLRETCYYWADRAEEDELENTPAFSEIEKALSAILGTDKEEANKALSEFWIEVPEGYRLHIKLRPDLVRGRRGTPEMKVPVTVDINKITPPRLDLGSWEFNISPNGTRRSLKYHISDLLYILARKLLDVQYAPLLNLYQLNKEHLLSLSLTDPTQKDESVSDEE